MPSGVYKRSAEQIEIIRKNALGRKLAPASIEKIRQAHLGKRHTKESIEKMRAAKLGKPLTEEHRKNLSESHKGYKITDETKEKLRKINTGKKMSPEAIAKSSRKGKKHTPESIEKMRQAHKGIKTCLGRKVSEETKRKIGAANRGRVVSDQVREKLRNANLGKVHSVESIQKMREAKIGKKFTKKHIENLRKAKLGTIQSKEAKEKLSASISGEKHWNWQGGKSREPYSIDWIETLRRSIRERDHYTCQLCSTQQCDRAFAVHHVDYDKMHNDPSNLITLCTSCHVKTNSNREHWTNYFNQKYQEVSSDAEIVIQPNLV